MVCIHCGKESQDESEFCPHGVRTQSEDKDNTKVGIVFLAIIVLVVCLVAVGIIYDAYQEKQREKMAIEAFKNSNFSEEMQNIVSDYEEKTDELLKDMEQRK